MHSEAAIFPKAQAILAFFALVNAQGCVEQWPSTSATTMVLTSGSMVAACFHTKQSITLNLKSQSQTEKQIWKSVTSELVCLMVD